jgi:hypothetical protein
VAAGRDTMPILRDIFQIVQILLLFGFLGLTSMVFVVALLNRSNIRNLLLVVHKNRFRGVPLLPSVFLLCVTTLFAISWLTSQPAVALLYLGYMVGGALWLASRYLSQSTYVTRYGLMTSLGSSSRVAWSQVHDCFDVRVRRGRIFVLLYGDALGVRRRHELFVPTTRVKAFERILDRHIYWNADYTSTAIVDYKALEGEE